MMVDKVSKSFSVALHFAFSSMEGPQYEKQGQSVKKRS